MTAYAIGDVKITDPAKFEKYRSQAPETIKKYGGRYIVRGGPIVHMEGDWNPSRLVVIEFDTMTQLKKWYHSKEYRGPKQLRHESSNTNVVFVEGI